MPNNKGLRFATVGLTALEPARFRIALAPPKGKGVFLKGGIAIEKATHVMKYGGRLLDTNPQNDYTYEIGGGRFIDASKESYCKKAGAFHMCSRKLCTNHVTFTGLHARLVNHSCSPNCGARFIKGCIIFVALKALSGNEEITIE